MIKNFKRISEIENFKDFPFPMKTKIIYETKNFNNINLNSPISQGNIQSGVCWDTPIYCRVGNFDNINIYKKKDYLVITPK